MNSNSGVWRFKHAGAHQDAPVMMGLKRLLQGRDLLTIAAIAVAYFLSGAITAALIHLAPMTQVSILYPPIAVAMTAVLLLNRRSTWIGIALGAFWFAKSFEGASTLPAIGAALGSTIQVIVAQSGLNRLGFDRSMRRVQDVLAFIGVAAILAPGINALIRTANGFASGTLTSDDLVNHALMIGLGDAIAILVITPVFLVWVTRPLKVPFSLSALTSTWRKSASFRWRAIEVGLWLILALGCTSIALTVSFQSIPTGWQGATRVMLQYAPFPFIVWASLRLGQRGTVLSSVLISSIAIATVTHAYDNFLGLARDELQHVLFHLQTFLSVMTIVALVLAAAIAEREEAELQLRRQIRQDQLLSEGILRMRQSLDINEILNTTVAEVRQFFNADRVHIAVFDQEGYTDVLAESVAPGWNSLLSTRSPRPILSDIQAVFSGQPVRVNHDTDATEKNEFLRIYYSLYQVKASLAVPILQDGHYFGVLNVHQCSSPRQWQPYEVELLQQLALQLELAIQQGSLYQQVQNAANNLEQQVQERTLELQQNNQIKDTLLHAVTHDLRTPTIGMLMVLKKLRDKSHDPQVVIPRPMLERMIESSERQLDLIRSLLEDSEESLALVLSYQSFSFSTLVLDVLQSLESMLSQNRAVLQNLVPLTLPKLSADPMQVRRVLENLITNALNHNAPEVEITISAEVVDQKLRCAIADNGVGMTQEQCDQLFKKPFLRGSHNHHRTGLGLGLFLCNQVVMAHGGEIGVNSSPNAGATFWFTIPSRAV